MLRHLIAGPVTVHGRLAPGNSPGTLHASATVEMQRGSIFQQDINGLGTGAGPGNYSRLLITGAGNQFIAGGATLVPNLVGITGSDTYTPYVPQLGDAFRIISAEGGVVRSDRSGTVGTRFLRRWPQLEGRYSLPDLINRRSALICSIGPCRWSLVATTTLSMPRVAAT